MIKAIVFDWHGVLDLVKFEGLVHKLAELSKKPIEELKVTIKFSEREYARGSNPDKFWDEIKSLLNLTDEQVQEAQNYILKVERNQSLWDLLPSLSIKYSLVILSDCPQDKMEIIKNDSDLSIFRRTYFSCESKLLKSDNIFFSNVLKDLNLKAEECLYVDDSLKNVEIAKRLGFDTCLFSTTKDLIDVLNR